MSGAKRRIRDKKMRNQPSSVTYSSAELDTRRDESCWHNGQGQRYEQSPQTRGRGPPPSGSTLGGQHDGWVRGCHGRAPQELPRFITASTFAMARAAEVQSMLKAVAKTTGSCHVFGALPKHMRRRAMSHNVKRLPRRLREGAQRMLEKSRQAGQKDKKDQPKSKSRKARRRHSNLLLEFNRRQRKNVWLETHIWHAKRFHMVKQWGYCLGDRPTYKCYRACHRAMGSSCLLQDLSYYCCLELMGPEGQLLGALSKLASKETGPTFAAAMCLSGRRQGSAVLYRADGYPTEPLGPVLFLWRPRSEGSTDRQLWIWAHPSLKQELLLELQSVCQCSQPVALPTLVTIASSSMEADPVVMPKGSAEEPPAGRKRKKMGRESDQTVPAKKIVGDGTRSPAAPTSWRSDSTGIVIGDLTMELVRYRLIGPLSHGVLADALTPASDCDGPSKTKPSFFWWPEHCKEESNMVLHQQQAHVFQQLRGLHSTAEVPSGCVLGLTVDDPRLTMPNGGKPLARIQRQQGGDGSSAEEAAQRLLMLQGVPEPCCQSSLWDRCVRDSVAHNKISEQELNRMKSELLVPGSRLQPTPLQGRVPILLMQQPGKQTGGEMVSWGVGWDLLLPKGWGMAFWVPLVYQGVRVGGLREALKHSQNKGAPHFPHDYPDCPTGAQFLQEQAAELCEKYKRRPPAKRPNYIKYGCLAPFLCPWQQLCEEWEVIVKEEDPTRTQPDPGAAAQEVTSQARFSVLRNRKVLQQLSAWCRPTSSRGQRLRQPAQLEQLTATSVESLSRAHCSCLVWVRISLLRRGHPVLHAMICAPTPEDLALLGSDPTCCGPLEPRHTDHFKSRVKRCKKGGSSGESAHKLEEGAEPGPAPSLTPGLWPDPLPSVTSHCSRVTLGWATQGDFSLTAGCGEALAFVSLTGLLHTLLQQPPNQRGVVLLRNPASLQYRFAKLTVEV
ncbi:ribonucleases P/MRP protein subunit POP1 [Scleropages formosus]|uniref:POP1 homolog, ribonuclease P/MRP subunit n=1 Tax=Scleropages formosus TaxID=113540 RepID=A0A8C9RGG7_SCLFO|nr:ribonucleases P/MRP protein subunit POP1 [Scleropages formosus]